MDIASLMAESADIALPIKELLQELDYAVADMVDENNHRAAEIAHLVSEIRYILNINGT